MLDFRHPNVKIEREKGKASWVHLDNCKLAPRELTEHLIPQESEVPAGTAEDLEPSYPASSTAVGQEVEEKETERQRPLRRSTRPKKMPDRLDL